MIRKVDDLIEVSDKYCEYIYLNTQTALPKRFCKPCFQKLIMKSESNMLQSFIHIIKYIKLIRKYTYIHDIIAKNISNSYAIKMNTRLLNCLKSENLSFLIESVPRKHRKHFLLAYTSYDDLILSIFFNNAGVFADNFYKQHRIVRKQIEMKNKLVKTKMSLWSSSQ